MSHPPSTWLVDRPGSACRTARHRGVVQRVAASALLAAALAAVSACGGSNSDAQQPSPSPTRTQGTGTTPVRLPVPDGFDATRGWNTKASPETPDVQAGSSGFPLVAVAPRTNLVVQAAADGSRVQAYDLATGKVAWTFTPAALSDARTGVFVVTVGGREQVLLARQGKTSGDGLNQSAPTVTVDIIPARSPAKATAAHHLDLPGPSDQALSFAASDSGFLVGAADHGTYSQATVIDPATGAKRSVKAKDVTVSGCGGSTCTLSATPAFATSAGVVSTYQQTTGCDQWGNGSGQPCTTGFQVGDAWTSTTTAPRGMHTGIPLAVTGKYLIAAWHTSDSQTDQPVLSADSKTTFTVQDLATGKTIASVSCTSADRLILQPGSAQSSTRTSANGRYLVSGQTAFDLNSRTGRCYTSSASSKGIDFTAVGDDGTAYGLIHTGDGSDASSLYGRLPIAPDGTDSTEQGARVDLAAGSAKALSEAAEVPIYLAASNGVFRTGEVLAIYARR
ncbi:hypothetical protein AB0B42_01265 [Streptomyces fradiae]|uniref:hypothetical protein n=1 Tax=Streptomyces fradiae TaxID=1906 RepID=UPI0033D50B58